MTSIFEKNKKSILCFVILLGFAIFTYSELMVNQLVNNYDGIWEGNFHNAGVWEMSLGRWFWCYLSRLRFGIANDPVISIITLSLFVFGIMLAANLLEVKNGLITVVSGAAFLCTPLVCADLSYRYMSPTFGTAFMLAVLAVFLATRIKKAWLAVLLGSLAMALSLGSYQAYIGVACVVTLSYFIKILFEDNSIKYCLKKLIRPVITILAGGVLYIIFLKLHLMITHVTMSDYMGASDYSLLSVLKNIPSAFINTYQLFWKSMTGICFNYNKLTAFGIEFIVGAVMAAAAVYYLIKRINKNVWKVVGVIMSVLLMPAAANAVFFITQGVPYSIQMTAGFFMVLPALTMALPYSFDSGMKEKIPAWILACSVATFAYGGFYQVQTDQSAMYEGTLSTVSIADAALDRVSELGYLNTDNKYCFIGNPVGSELYHLDKAAQDGNNYAIFGAFWGEYSSEKSWQGVINDRMGLNLNIVSYYEYCEIASNEDVQSMPAFPEDGSVIMVDDVVVIKISN